MNASRAKTFLLKWKKKKVCFFHIAVICSFCSLSFNLLAQTPGALIDMALDDISEINDSLADNTPSDPFEIEEVIQLNEKSLNTLQNTQIKLLLTYDTSFMAEEVPIILLVLNRIREKITIQDSKVNLQVLNELENMIKGYENQISRWQEEATRRSTIILKAGNQIKEIKNVTIRQPVFQDTTALPAFLGQSQVLANRLNQVDSLFTIKRLQNLQVQSKLSGLVLQINGLREEIKKEKIVIPFPQRDLYIKGTNSDNSSTKENENK